MTSSNITNQLTIDYLAVDTYFLDINGFGGPRFDPADKHAWNGGPYDQFVDPTRDEFDIFKAGKFGDSLFATLGADYEAGVGAACYFAAGLRPDSLPSRPWGYGGRIDGLAQIGGPTLRLFNDGAKILPGPGARTGTLQLTLAGRESPFGDYFTRTATDIATVTAPITLRADGYFDIGPLSGGGFSGSAQGGLVGAEALSVGGSGGAGAILAFELHNASGEIIVGVVAADANLI